MSKPKNPMRKFREDLHDADSVLRLVTGRGIGDYAKIAVNLFGKQATTLLMGGGVEPECEYDKEDLADCRIFGTDNFYAERVFLLVVKLFRIDNHPDKFPLDDKSIQEQRFKEGEQAARRIAERRGWKIP